MPIDFSGLPDKAPGAAPAQTQSGIDFSGLPDKSGAAPGTFEKLGGWRGLGGLGIRALSGLLGVEGLGMGATISGLGETAAEMLEKGTWDPREVDPARVASAAAVGAVPFGSVVKGGRVAASALRSGALSGGGETLREALAGEHFDPKAAGTAALLGAAGGAGGSKLATMFGVAGEKLPQAAAAEERPLAKTIAQQTSEMRRQLGRQSQVGEEVLPSGSRTFDLGEIPSPKIEMESRPPAPVGPGAPQMGMPAEASGRVQRVIAREESEAAKAAKEAEKLAAEQRIEQEIAERGLEPGTASVSEAATGKKSMRIPWKAPAEDAETAGMRAATRDFTPEEYARFNAPEAQAAEFVTPETNPLRPRGTADRFNPDEWLPEESVPAPEYRPYAGERQLGPAPAAAAGGDWKSALLGPEGPKGGFDWPEAGGRFEPDLTGSHVQASPAPSALDEFFGTTKKPFGPSTEVNQMAKDYAAAKAAEAAGGPSADPAYEAFAAARKRAGLETAPRTSGKPPAIVEPGQAPGQDWVADQTAVADAAAQNPGLRDRLLTLSREEKGAVSPELTRLLTGLTGAAVGAPIGARAYGEDDPWGAAKGALGGAIIGANVGKGANALVNLRNANLLASGGPISKNVLGDIGGMTGETLKQFLTPGARGYAVDLLKNHPVLNPLQYLKDYKQAFLHPESGATAGVKDIAGEMGREFLDRPMELIYRPFEASNFAIGEAMRRAGAPARAIQEASGISTPNTRAMQTWLGLQKHPFFRFLFPFQKIASNILEGTQNIPGVSLKYGNPADRLQRTAMGGLQMALGSGAEMYDESQAAQGTPTGTLTKALRPQAFGPKMIAPFAVGQALTAIANEGPAKALSELVNMIPGAHAVLPAAYPNESADEYARRVLSGPISNMIPSALKPGPDSGSVR